MPELGSQDSGYFRWDSETVYGRSACGALANEPDSISYEALTDTYIRDEAVVLPFDPEEVLENLQHERYSAHFRKPGKVSHEIMRKLYYLLRPYLSVPVRKHLQKIHLRNWDKISFPKWPVDCTVDAIQNKLLALSMRAQHIETTPFIWFWPDDYEGCAILTHDVEDEQGKNFCDTLMDIDESFGFRSSFQVVPEDRYTVSKSYLDRITNRGFEVNVHDLKHDGRLYAEYQEFRRRVVRINEYGRQFGAVGFRSGILYRNADWYDAFDFEYDMSIPNVAHLDPQRGGCCTVMPYFIGKMIEVPITCTQDYTLFHILRDFNLDLWKRQIELIQARNGLISILVHPDYVIDLRAQQLYKSLLSYLAELCIREHIWTPLPREVADWWRQRSQMKLVQEAGQWRIEGEGKERARIAYAHAVGDGAAYSFKEKMEQVVS
jgi:hypothetical protein